MQTDGIWSTHRCQGNSFSIRFRVPLGERVQWNEMRDGFQVSRLRLWVTRHSSVCSCGSVSDVTALETRPWIMQRPFAAHSRTATARTVVFPVPRERTNRWDDWLDGGLQRFVSKHEFKAYEDMCYELPCNKCVKKGDSGFQRCADQIPQGARTRTLG